MKIVSFLGVNYYQETTYIGSGDNQKCTTPFFQEALVEFLKPEILYVLLTKSAETKIPDRSTEPNWLSLQKRLKNKKVEIRPISNIPETNRPEDVWMIFQEVTNLLDSGDRVIFDITHSFRSVPIVALLAVSYLRVVRDVKIEGLLYGAYEARNTKNETPIFDLLPIVSLLNWTTATDQFIKTGDAETLANLLKDNNSQSEKLSKNIQNIAQGLKLLRPMDVMRESANLTKYIQEANPVISESIPPFSTLSDRIVEDYGKFGLADPENYTENSKTALLKQLQMIEWYAEKQQIVQALSLAREWLPSLLCDHFGLDPQVDRPHRDEMELLLNGGTIKRNGEIIRQSLYLEQWKNLDRAKIKRLKNLWGGSKFNLANLRNDALHAGFRKTPKSASAIIEQTHRIISELKQIAIEWDLFE